MLRLSRFLKDQRGQSLSEYIILVLLVGIVCLPLSRWLPTAVRGYLRPIYYSVSKPFP